MRHALPALALLLPLLLAAGAAAEERRPLWMAVGPEALRAPLAELAEHRRAQGMEVLLVSGPVEEALARAPRRPDYLLLAGDDSREGGEAAWRLPALRRRLYRWRAVQREEFASDSAYADAVAIGRIPARTPEQVQAVVRKTIAYERAAARPKDLRLVVWAGAPGYGGLVDRMATATLLMTVNRHAPAWSGRFVISGDAHSPLSGWPPEQPRLFTRALREGALLGAIVAHANADAVFSMRYEDRGIWYSGQHVRALLSEGPPCAPLVLLACNCGEFDRPRASLAELMLFAPGGPAAVVGATTESHPLTNYLTGVCLLKALAGAYGPRPRLGDLWHEAQQRAQTERDPVMEAMLKDVEGKLEERIDVAKLRRDQPRLYVLLGDPALRLKLPAPLEATLERTESGWRWSATRPEGAVRLHVGFRELRPVPAPGTDEATRRRAFREANAAQAFEPLATLEEQPWSGTLDRRKGQLRLVAESEDGVLRVALLELGG